MTYCVAWKTTECAYLIADSAVTRDENHSDHRLETSFGERQGRIGRNNECVYEGAYKIYSTENISIALIGDANFGNSFIELLLNHIQLGRTVDDAISKSINNYLQFSDYPHIQIVIAFHDRKPKIISIDNKALPIIEHDRDFVVFGSHSEDLAEYTRSFYSGFFKTWKDEFEISDKAHEYFLIRMLALLQIYGVHNFTLEHGVGGAYTGVLVSKTGVSLQPDICYVISGEDPAFNTKKLVSIKAERDHFFITNTNISNIFISNLGVDSQAEEERLKSTIISALDTFDSGRFSYYIFLNMARHSAVAIDMNKQIHHMVLSIDIREELQGTIGLIISAELQRNLNVNFEPIETPKDAQIMLYSYIPASVEKIALIENRIEEIRLSKIYSESIDKYIFVILENDKEIRRFYGNEITIFPFIKHYREYEHIIIVDLLSDMCVLEYKCGQIEFPNMECKLDEVLDKISPKKVKENLYIFETLTKNNTPHTLKTLACDYESAYEIASSEIGDGYLRFVGVKFYHPAYIF